MLDQFRITSEFAAEQLSTKILQSEKLPKYLTLERMFSKPSFACIALNESKIKAQSPSELMTIRVYDENLTEQVQEDLVRQLADRERYPSLAKIFLRGPSQSDKSASAKANLRHAQVAADFALNGVTYSYADYNPDYDI